MKRSVLGPLLLLVIVLGGPGVFAQSIDSDGTLGFEGTVPGDPPQSAPVITNPTNGATFTSIPVLIRGSCEAGLLVKIFKNDVFAGSGICDGSGVFEIPVALFNGINILRANQFDANDQSSPDSNLVEVTFNDPAASVQFIQIKEFFLTVNFARKGIDPGRPIDWTVGITGGRAPYALSFNWGDGSEDLFSTDSSGNFSASHIYDNPGTYIIVVKGSDANGLKSFIQFVTVVNGEPGSATTNNDGLSARVIERYVVWPVIVLAVLAISNFYFGQRYQVNKETRKIARISKRRKEGK